MNDITAKLFKLVKEDGVPELDAWNQTSQQLITAARVTFEENFNIAILAYFENFADFSQFNGMNFSKISFLKISFGSF
jgi:hypothetical protein